MNDLETLKETLQEVAETFEYNDDIRVTGTEEGILFELGKKKIFCPNSKKFSETLLALLEDLGHG